MYIFDLKKGKKFLPWIIFIGIGIGTANYILNRTINWSQFLILSLSTSIVIGYSSVTIASNKDWFFQKFNKGWKIYGMTSILFLLFGAFSIELEHIIHSFLFSKGEFSIFSTPKMNLFNGILSFILGHSFFQNHASFPNKSTSLEKSETEVDSQPFNKVPVKEGNTILLLNLDEIAYFEAFDNYSNVYTLKGEKKLCDYSLSFLQSRLNSNFIRIHRKYIANKNQIKQIQSHTNSRYKIYFEIADQIPIMSSKTYASEIKALTKIK